MEEANEIIAHNGDRFDEKWIRTRCLYHRIKCAPKYQSLDTLKAVRSHFNFNSNRLDYICRFLGLDAKLDTGGFDLWKKVTLDNDRRALSKMVDYCKNDVVILQRVYDEIFTYIKHKTHHGVLTGQGEKWDCPNCGSQRVGLNKTNVTASGTLKRIMKCHECETYFSISDSSYKKQQAGL